jgi:hypothetical protein
MDARSEVINCNVLLALGTSDLVSPENAVPPCIYKDVAEPPELLVEGDRRWGSSSTLFSNKSLLCPRRLVAQTTSASRATVQDGHSL